MILTGIGPENVSAFEPLMDGVFLPDFAFAAGAVEDDEAVGVALFNELGDALMIDYIYVSEKFRRKGIGTALVKETVNMVGNGRQIPVHVNFPDRADVLREFFFSLGFRLYRDGRSYHALAASFLESASFQKLISAEPKNRVMRVSTLTKKEIQVLKNCMEGEDLDPAALDDDMLSGKLSLVTMNSATAKPTACILAEQKEKWVTILYLVNFSHDPKQIVDIFRAFKDAIVREKLEDCELRYVAMNEQTEVLAGKLAEAKSHIHFDSKVISALLLWDEDARQPERDWMSDQIAPAKAAGDPGESASEIFLTRTLSKSQRTKRGKKFAEKAKLQAGMRIEMFQLLELWRSLQPDEKLPPAKQKDLLTFYNSVTLQTACSAIELARSAALYNQFAEKPVDDGLLEALNKDPEGEKTKELLTESVSKLLKELDLSAFDYETDADFLKTEGKPGFAARYMLLRFLFNAKKLAMELTDNELRKRAALIDEIFADYEIRALLVQSPYYTLMANRDIDDMKTEELEIRYKQTEFEMARTFLQMIMAKSKTTGFKKGMSAEKRLADIP